MAISTDAMLAALHKADPKTLKQRYTPEQLKAAYAKISGGKAANPATGTVGNSSGIPDKITTVGQGVEANKTVANDNATNTVVRNNADITNPYGSSTTTIDPVTGKATMTQRLSDPQQQILNKDQQLSNMGRQIALDRLNPASRMPANSGIRYDPTQDPNASSGSYGATHGIAGPRMAPAGGPQGAPQGFVAGEPAPGTSGGVHQTYPAPGSQPKTLTTTGGDLNSGFAANTIGRVSTGDVAADRARIEDAAYKRLTRYTQSDYDREKQQTEQTLHDRGIALDPANPAYKSQMDDLNRRYEGIRADAANQAVATGGTEYSRDVGLNEQVIANQFSQQQGARNQNVNELGTFSNLGPGVHDPGLPGYVGPGSIQTPSATDISTQQQTLTLEQQKAKAAIDALKKNNSGGGGNNNSSVPQSPFQG